MKGFWNWTLLKFQITEKDCPLDSAIHFRTNVPYWCLRGTYSIRTMNEMVSYFTIERWHKNRYGKIIGCLIRRSFITGFSLFQHITAYSSDEMHVASCVFVLRIVTRNRVFTLWSGDTYLYSFYVTDQKASIDVRSPTYFESQFVSC